MTNIYRLFSPCLRASVAIIATASSISVSQVRHDTWIPVGPADSLDATYFLPTTPPPPKGFPMIVFVHGFGFDKDDEIPNSELYAQMGYATMTISVRGHGNSTGLSTIMGAQEREDFRRVLQFAKRLPTVDSTAIGVSGGSQGGLHALWAMLDTPGIRAASANVIVPRWASDMLAYGSARRTLMLLLRSASVRYAPVRDTLWSLLSTDQLDQLRTLFARDRDLDTAALERSNIPLSLLVKWQDHYFTPPGGISMYQRYPAVKKFYLGTVGHFSDLSDGESTVQFDQVSRWFAQFLKGDATGILAEPPVTCGYSSLPMDSTGNFTWAHMSLASWPPATAQPFRFYLERDSVLSYWSPAGKRDSLRLVNALLDTGYTFEMGYLENFQGPHFEKVIPKKVLSFTSEPLTRDLFWLGAPRMYLQVRSDSRQFPLYLHIYEVDAAGQKFFVNRIPFTARGWVPGSAGVIDIEGIPHAHRFTKGNRIRMELTNLDVNNRPTWGKYPFSIPMLGNFSATVYLGGVNPSFIELPMEGVPVGVSPLSVIAQMPRLYQNYPNPFNGISEFGFGISDWAEVKLQVFDLLGREVATLVNERKAPGEYTLRFDAGRLASGTYLYRLKAGSYVETRKMLLLR